jgi:hypothetical protein
MALAIGFGDDVDAVRLDVQRSPLCGAFFMAIFLTDP